MENKNLNLQTGKYTISVESSSEWRLKLRDLINQFLNFFSLRKTRQFWGVVYDSVSKQPLDPVIVKLFYADGGEAETGVTDLNGHYGFLARPGMFKIFVRKTNYTFPSKYVSGDKDGIYENLYHGEFFTLKEDSEVLAPNIPMDPEGVDWNQQAKAKLGSPSPYGELFVKRIMAVLFWFWLIFCLLAIWNLFPNVPIYLFCIAAVYLILILLAVYFPEPRLWGEIFLGPGINEPLDLSLELHKEKIPGIIFGKAMIHPNGKFLLRSSPGNYLLEIYAADKVGQKSLAASLPIKVGKAGVFNLSLFINRVA